VLKFQSFCYPNESYFQKPKTKTKHCTLNVIHSGYTRRDYPWSCLFSFSCFNSWLAKLVKKIMLNANTAMPILYVSSMSEKKSAKTDTSISANTRTSCTPLRLPKPVLKLIFAFHLSLAFSRRHLLVFSFAYSSCVHVKAW